MEFSADIAWIVVAVGILLFLFRLRGRQNAVAAQPVKPVSLDDVRQALMDRKKIEAIKIYRRLNGVGLKEAKDSVEALESELRQKGVLPK